MTYHFSTAPRSNAVSMTSMGQLSYLNCLLFIDIAVQRGNPLGILHYKVFAAFFFRDVCVGVSRN